MTKRRRFDLVLNPIHYLRDPWRGIEAYRVYSPRKGRFYRARVYEHRIFV